MLKSLLALKTGKAPTPKRFKPKQVLAALNFIFYHTISHSLRQKLEREMTGSAGQKRVQVDSLGNYVIPFPGRSERRSIVDILSAQDSIIVLKEKRLAEKQQQKKIYHAAVADRQKAATQF